MPLDDDDDDAPAAGRGRVIALVVIGLLVVGGVAAGVYFALPAKQQAGETAEAPAAKEEPSQEKPTEPARPTHPTFLPEPTTPRELSGDEVYRRLLRSTAFILTVDKRAVGVGSGVLIDTDQRLVLTNAHVVGNHSKVLVLFPAYERGDQVITDANYYVNRLKDIGLVADVVSRDPRRDLALVRLEKLPLDVRPVRVSKQPAATGSAVYSVGGSGANDELLWRLTTGTVRARSKRDYRDASGSREYMCLETQSPTNKGDSGGPVVNGRVELVAIVAALSTRDRLVSMNVDLSEIRDFVGDYFRSINRTWMEPEPESSPNLPGSAAVFENLLAVLKGGVPVDRVAAARRLGVLGTGARPAVPALLAALDGADEELQTAIAAALTRIGAPEAGAEKVLVQAYQSKFPVARLYAARRFATDTAIPEDSVKLIVAALRDESPELRSLAAAAIGKIGPKARPAALGLLLDSLTDKDQAVREACAAAIQAVGTPDRADQPVLLKRLKHADLRVRLAAVTLLGPLATTGEGVNDFADALKDEASEIRVLAVSAFGKAGPKARPTALGLLLDRLADKDQAVREAATAALKAVGPPDKDDKAVLLTFAKHADLRVRVAALDLLVPLATTREDVLAVWVPLLQDSEPQLRLSAVTALTSTKELVASSGSDLLPLLPDPDPKVRLAVARAAQHLTPSADVTDQLTKQLDSESDAAVKAALTGSLLALTKPDTRNLALFRRFLKDTSPIIREESARKIAAIGPEAAEAIPTLISLLGDEATDVRVASLDALAAMGTRAKEAVPTAAELFDRERTPAPVLAAAVRVLANGGGDGMDRLETLSRKALPESVRVEVCRAFAKTSTVSEATRTWMIDQAETLEPLREAAATALVKTGTNATIQELIRRTYLYKPRKAGGKEEKYPADFRKWVLVVLRKMDATATATRETRRQLIERLEYLTKNDASEDIIAEARAVLSTLGK